MNHKKEWKMYPPNRRKDSLLAI